MEREGQLVERIARALRVRGGSGSRRGGRLPELRAGVRLGIGDDAAVLRCDGRHDWVVSCDASVAGVHFRIETHPANSVGYKSLVRAASDLAAMGATPAYYLLTLALPSELAGRWLDEFLSGMRRAARTLGIVAVGGDTTRSSSVSVNVTVIGQIASGRAVTRVGAKPGDLIYVSGALGRAELGLRLTLAGAARRESLRRYLAPHLYPEAKIELGEWIARSGAASAMMDLSDGLSTDLGRLCNASTVGAELWSDAIPRVTIPNGVKSVPGGMKDDALQMALHGGEDYELLFTVPGKNVRLLARAPRFAKLAAIGKVTRGQGITLIETDGRRKTLQPDGWDSFRTS